MCKLFDDWSEEIEKFCVENKYDFEKAKNLSQCWGSNFLALQYYDSNIGKSGLLDETPMPLVLLVSKENKKLRFETTEYTKKYLT